MVAPLIAAGLSIGASFIPQIVNTLLGSKSPEEAKQAIYPQYSALVQQKLASGLGYVEAQQEADAELEGAIQEERTKGPIPPWLETTLSLAAGLGTGAALGLGKTAGTAIGKLGGMIGKKAAPAVDDVAMAATKPMAQAASPAPIGGAFPLPNIDKLPKTKYDYLAQTATNELPAFPGA